MVTILGKKMAQRVAASLLRAANLPELVCKDTKEYEDLAVTLAVDGDKYMDIRERLEMGRESCPLFDTPRWVRNMEKGLEMIWEKHVKGEPVAHIDVPDVGAAPQPRPPIPPITVNEARQD